MKPLLVEMQAFGPFAGRQVVDFKLLGNKTFFLIHGPTGSGKTTILDAMCFALFGDSSGGEREGHDMRSDHADAATLTEVSFDFALGDQRFRVHRIPEQMRKAKRGDGEAREPQSAELFRVEQDGEKVVEQAIETGWSRVTTEVEALLGFESRQFRQVIMLPQGKFFEFLKSSSQEREKILQTLFGTELYKRIEDRLSRAAAEVAREAEVMKTKRQTLLDQANAAAEAEVEDRLVQQASELAARRSAELVAAQAAQAAERTLTEARKLADRFDEFDKATKALQTLQSDEPEWTSKTAQLVRARQAATIQPYVASVDELDRQLADEATRHRESKLQEEATAKSQRSANDTLDKERLRAPEIEQLITRVAALEALGAKVTALDAARRDYGTAVADAKRAQSAKATADKAFKDAADLQKKLTSEIQDLRVRAASVEGLRGAEARLKQQLDQANNLAKVRDELAKAAKLVDERARIANTAQQSTASAKQARENIHHAWLAGQAARLARELVAGEACPVCGAHDHPAPAHFDGELVLDDTLKSAEDALGHGEAAQREAEGKLAEAQKVVHGLETRIDEILSALTGVDDSVEQLKARSEAASLALKQAEAAASALKTQEPKLTATETALSQAEATAKDAATLAANALTRQQQHDAVLKERQVEVPGDLADVETLRAAQTATARSLDELKRAFAAASVAASNAQSELTRVKALLQASAESTIRLQEQRVVKSADLTQRLRAAGFDGNAEFRAASLGEQQMAAMQATIKTFDNNLAAAMQRHERAGNDTRELVRPDVAGITVQHDGAKAAHLAASNAVRDAIAAHDGTKVLADALRQLAGKFHTLQERYAVVKKVADVATGSNAQRMSFQRYVLATLLEEVLAATTLRLKVMSRGRYEIRRKLQPVDQRSAAGLDMEVFDHYTGATRPVSTLSGGETFLASLALALGLSDVVQSYAGGIRLDAIFVDEGFGTLDAEALDFAIRALKDLQQTGRIVGIISHVTELREWIDARLELKAGPSGSVAEFVV